MRYTTLIVLPENEEILDFTTGDKDFWIINGAHNLCYIHPAQTRIRSNLNLITASGHVYSKTRIGTNVDWVDAFESQLAQGGDFRARRSSSAL